MATETAVALDSNFKLLLMSRILVAGEKIVASCYNRDQTWLCVYCWCQTPEGVVSPWGDHSGCALVIARRGETTPLRVWHQQYTHNHVWSLKQYFVKIVLQQIWLYEIIGVMWLMCQNITMWVYGAWIKTYYILCPKTYISFGNVS